MVEAANFTSRERQKFLNRVRAYLKNEKTSLDFFGKEYTRF